ncbi:Lon protease [Salmonella enterica subsp. enterica serovar Choleraesuis]|nr:Lon protease [Salmonella enterica subsp. enterica serovar Choleraesuis]
MVKAAETNATLSLLARQTSSLFTPDGKLHGGRYIATASQIELHNPIDAADDFTSSGQVIYADWVEPEQLFGCLRQFREQLSLQPGLIHQANGGILILSLRSVLAQPLMWLRLKQMVAQKRFDWLSEDETSPLPVSIPSLPLDLRLILTGERESLADFSEMEPELCDNALYGELEALLTLNDEQDMATWCQWVNHVADGLKLKPLACDAWPVLIREAARHTGDSEILPLEIEWLQRLLSEAKPFASDNVIDASALTSMLEQRNWRQGYLADRMRDEILQQQILIETEGARVGQVNALSVLEFPGHPQAFGEPSRISCVVHVGDGEFIDVERKAELGGNLHAKAMMIIQAFLMGELNLDQQLPFSASLTFEQSYGEVDGDSASMAELTAVISALAGVPVNQHIAITGSVDQFGRTQPVGGLNEKIEGFFRVCQQRELTGEQGVIIPTANVRHLSLPQDLLDAVEAGQFTLWAVDDVREALMLLTNVPWQGDMDMTLVQLIQERIAQANQQDSRTRYPWPLRWLNWFNHN